MAKKKKSSVQQRAEAYEQKINKRPEKADVINYMKFASSIYNNRKLDEPELSFKDMIKSDEFKEYYLNLKN